MAAGSIGLVYLLAFTIKSKPNVGKYTVRPMDPMGRERLSKQKTRHGASSITKISFSALLGGAEGSQGDAR